MIDITGSPRSLVMACAYSRMAADVTADISPAEPQKDQICTISDRDHRSTAYTGLAIRKDNVERDISLN